MHGRWLTLVLLGPALALSAVEAGAAAKKPAARSARPGASSRARAAKRPAPLPKPARRKAQTAQTLRAHQLRMQQMQWAHEQRMAQLHLSFQAHLARMASLRAAGDARLQNWHAQQAAGDAAHQRYLSGLTGRTAAVPGGGRGGHDARHRRFLNTIMEQETVVGRDGARYQVPAGYRRYYRHKYNGSVIGADRFTERGDLRARFGVNADDYEEVRIRR